MRTVKFLKQTTLPGGPMYHPGEVADLRDEEALSVIRFGAAEYLERATPPAEPEAVLSAPPEAPLRRPRK